MINKSLILRHKFKKHISTLEIRERDIFSKKSDFVAVFGQWRWPIFLADEKWWDFTVF